GSNGIYSGTGYIVVPYLADTKVKVSFNNIKLNTDRKLIEGIIETTYDPTEKNIIEVHIVKSISDILKDLLGIISKDNPTDEDKQAYETLKRQWDFYSSNIDDINMPPTDKAKFEEIKKGLFFASTLPMSAEDKAKAIEKNKEAQEFCKKYKAVFDELKEKMTAKDASYILQEDSYFFTVSHQLIKLPKGAEIVFICGDPHLGYNLNGALLTFRTSEGIWNTTSNFSTDKKFYGFYLADENNTTWKWDTKKKNIIYKDENNKYSTGKQKVNFIHVVQNGETTEYRILQQEVNITQNQLPKNAYFSGNIDGNISYDKEKGIQQTITARNCKKALNNNSDLTDAQITFGDWVGGNDYEIRYTKNEEGIIQVKSFGFRKDLAISRGKNADLAFIAKEILDKTNKFLKDNKVKDINATYEDQTEAFGDGKRIIIKGSYSKIISEGLELTAELLKTATIKDQAYLNSTENKVAIHASGIVTGTVEAGTKAMTDITQPAVMVYSLVTDSKTRAETWNSLKEIGSQVANAPQKLYPILGEIILQEATGNTPEEWQEASNSDTDSGRQGHLYSKGAVRTVATIFVSGRFVSKLPEMADNLGKKIDDVVKNGVKATGNLSEFVAKTLPEKLEIVKNIWKTKYPVQEMLEGRSFFEDIMGEYRYKKADGWAHTGDISSNFRGVDFYKDYFELNNVISTKTAISMKTTITKDVNTWLKSEPIKKNLEFLQEGMGEGILSNGRRMKITEKARIDIYMPKENLTPELLQTWNSKLSETSKLYNNKIEFEIKSLEEFIK
ncbi:hypothetical protein JSO54_10255, partial [Riemerella anatipestifer]